MESERHQELLQRLSLLAEGLGKTFTPFCEVVVHDLTSPGHAIVSIENNLSGRNVGDPVTDLGLARLRNSSYQQVLANYENHFADGRRVKSTSIGFKDRTGRYVAALCLNIDVTLFNGLQSLLSTFLSVEANSTTRESLDPLNADRIRKRIDTYASSIATSPRALKTYDRRRLVKELKEAGVLELRHSTGVIAEHLGVSRATVYSDAK